MSSEQTQLHQVYGPGFAELSSNGWQKQAFPPAAIPSYHGISNQDASTAYYKDMPEPGYPGISCVPADSGWGKGHASAGAMTCSSCPFAKQG